MSKFVAYKYLKSAPDNKAGPFSAGFFEWLEPFVQAVVLVVFILAFIFRIVTVNGESMLDTLHNDDRLIVWKLNYKPKNGDIVVVSAGATYEKPIVKRIIALAGQKLSIDFKDGEIFVDERLIDEPYIKGDTTLQGNADIPNIIPDNYAFVMGDNRPNSLDSRSQEIGLIPYGHIVGEVEWIIWPFDRFGRVDKHE